MVGMLDALSLKNTKLGLETLDLMGFPSRATSSSSSTAPTQPRRHLATTRSSRSWAARPTSSCPSDRDIPRAVNEGKPIVAAKPQSEASKAFRAAGREPASTRAGGGGAPRAAASGALLREEGAEMELHERLSTPDGGQPGRAAGDADPFAELKNASTCS